MIKYAVVEFKPQKLFLGYDNPYYGFDNIKDAEEMRLLELKMYPNKNPQNVQVIQYVI